MHASRQKSNGLIKYAIIIPDFLYKCNAFEHLEITVILISMGKGYVRSSILFLLIPSHPFNK